MSRYQYSFFYFCLSVCIFLRVVSSPLILDVYSALLREDRRSNSGRVRVVSCYVGLSCFCCGGSRRGVLGRASRIGGMYLELSGLGWASDWGMGLEGT